MRSFSDVVRPFVFRKYLDYATLGAMRELHAEVRREVARRELADHVKLGPGGIREIEFIAQALQLARGGREPELTARPTLTILELLGQRRLLPAPAVEELRAAYVFLRNVEHRLQYLDDAQRHDLPRGRRGSRAPRAHVRFFELGRFPLHARDASARGLAPLRSGVRPVQGRGGALARASAARRAAREPALCRPAAGVAPAPRRRDPGARAGKPRDAGSGHHARARRRPGRGDREPSGVSGAARRAPAKRSSASRASSALRPGRPSS